GRKDAPWKLKVNGVTTPFAPTAARSARTTSKFTATLKDAFAAPPVNTLSVQTRARSLKHCAPHATSDKLPAYVAALIANYSTPEPPPAQRGRDRPRQTPRRVW